MPRTMKDILALAGEHRARKDWVRALKIYRLVLEAVPEDYEVRLNIGDALMALGEEALAYEVWKETFRHDFLSGHPMQAIVAAKRLLERDESYEPLFAKMAEHYHVDSEHVGRTSRGATVDLDVPVQEGVDVDFDIDTATLCKQTAALVVELGKRISYPEKVPPMPILSDLPPDLFREIIGTVRLLRLDPDQTFIEEGEDADTFFMLARGRVRIFKSDPMGKRVDLAELGEGSILGEMALLTNSPRTASVETVEDSDLLVFSKKDLERISEESIQVEAALDRFTRERLINNLLATNPIFVPFDKEQRIQLLSRFTVHEVVPNTVLVKQGKQGTGLFIILYGEVNVSKVDGDEEIPLARLRAGDVFGEISLIKDTPTTATVKSVRHSTMLFLPREYFSKLIGAIPELKEYFNRLSEQRLSNTRQTVESFQVPEGEDVVFDDDMIMI